MLKDDCMITVSQAVTDRLRQEIIDGCYEAGERITVNQIVKKYGVSPMPVREAFQCLKGEHLVELLQYKGAIVTPLDAKAVSDIYDVRGAIEVLIMTNIFKNGLSPEMVEKLKEINASIDFSRPADEVNQRYIETNELFHKTLFTVCDNRQATDMYVFYTNLLRGLRKRYPISLERIRASQREHYRMLDAFCEGDLDAIKSITTLHALETKRTVLSQMKQTASSAKEEETT